MTTPPTTTEMDSYVAANWDWILEQATDIGSQGAFLNIAGQADAIWWMVGYTDNASDKQYESLGMYPSGVVGATDAQLEANVPVTGNVPGAFKEPLPYINALIAAYGSVLLRGYFIPGIPWPPEPADSTVQAFVNDQANWGTAG